MEELELQKEKFNLIINKYNENSVDDLIINNIFSKYKILGKIKMSKNEQKRKNCTKIQFFLSERCFLAEKLLVRHTENFRDGLELKISNIAKLTFEL